MHRSRLYALVALILGPLNASHAAAVPPPGSIGGTQLSIARWIEHRVIPGERLAEIARRYQVEVAKLLEWNGLPADNPMLRAGQMLRVFTQEAPVARKRRSITVRDGDSWTKIARRFDVSPSKLHEWNLGASEELQPGDKVVVWVELEPAAVPQTDPGVQLDTASASAGAKLAPAALPSAATSKPSTNTDLVAMLDAVVRVPGSSGTAPRASVAPAPAPPATRVAMAASAKALPQREQPELQLQPSPKPSPTPKPQLQPRQPPQPSKPAPAMEALPIIDIATTGVSVGSANRGRLQGGVQLPKNDALYTIRNPDHSWGSSRTVWDLQRAIARFRKDTGFDRQILICDMSRQYGGRFRPHHSHTSGRDIDIQLPSKRTIPPGVIPNELNQVDWDATWSLVQALMSTGEVKYIFLSRSRQRPLYDAALRAGATRDELRALMQYPFHDRTALLRHSPGHVKHLHVRFACAPHETLCRDE